MSLSVPMSHVESAESTDSADSFVSADLISDLTDSESSDSPQRMRDIKAKEKVEKLVFLDWDDTLFPTSYVLKNIEYEIDETTNTVSTFSINGKSNESETQQFIAELDKTGQSAMDLLCSVLLRFESTNIKIVTNGQEGWLYESLLVAASFCEIYKDISRTLSDSKIEILYARDLSVDSSIWKQRVFDQLLWPHLCDSERTLHIVTIGDQWWDHDFDSTLSARMYSDQIWQHKVKLFANPTCRYLSVELQYLNELLHNDVFHQFPDSGQGLVLEFDGYEGSGDSQNNVQQE